MAKPRPYLYTDHPPSISVYAVGWLSALQFARNCLRRRWYRRALGKLRQEWHYTAHQARRRNWNAVKNTLNGYLAEHATLGRRAGHGWTKRRALRDLYRHLAEEGVRRG